MTKEQAIEKVNKIITTKFNNDYSIDNVDKEAIETILSMLEEQDKIIDLMSEKIYKEGIVWDNKEEVKQYFKNQAKEVQ